MHHLLLLPLLILCLPTQSLCQDDLRRLPDWKVTTLQPDLVPTLKPGDALGLELNLESFQALRDTRPNRTSMVIPFPDGELTVKLTRFDVRSDAFELAVTGPDGFRHIEPRTRIVTYEVEGEATGTLILFHDHVVASLRRGKKR